jgi:hypothetical protein
MSAAEPLPPLCWICRQRPAETAEHRFKASDVRTKVPTLSRAEPVFLQRDSRATNISVGSARSKSLKYPPSICGQCNSTLTQPYDVAWKTLSDYLQRHWAEIRRKKRFDLSKPFRGATHEAALNVHLFFVKLFGCKMREEGKRIDLEPFSNALLNRSAHPEVGITIADSRIGAGKVLLYDSEVHTMRNQLGELHGASWLYLVHPVAVKVHYMKAGAPLHVVGHLWHPNTSSKIVKLSPYIGGTEPVSGRPY